ncbi:MAG TPA: C39 family peptidase [Vicinamibacterales bacterium]|nr:C39 family peptidase [Vicinamibacterales bacterium]
MGNLRCFLFTWGAIALAGTGLSAQITVGAGGLRADRPARSVKDLRDANVVKQRFDFSCGAAALATMLRYGFADIVSERQILVDLFTGLSADDRRTAERTGFSLLDLQRVARTRGYEAEGFRLEPGELPMLGGPVIVFVEPRGYKHFAVLRGIRGDRVYLADPSRGNIRMPMHTFLDSWLQDDGRGIIFALEPKSNAPGSLPTALHAVAPVSRPEIIAVRELLKIGGTLRPPQPAR